MKNGFIIEIVEFLINLFFRLNIVEYFKELSSLFTKEIDHINKLKNILIDVFIILKFLFIALIIHYNWQSILITLIVWYLITTNVFTYFYYHLWKKPEKIDYKNQKRRFINLFISIVFSNLSFSYLYLHPYSIHFKLDHASFQKSAAITYSFFNSIFVTYEPFKPLDQSGYFISFIQLSITFIFISILLSNSIPLTKRD